MPSVCAVVVTSILAISSGTAFSQEQPPLTNADVVALVAAGLSPDVIAAKIAASVCRFDTSAAALHRLKTEGVPDQIVVAMLQASAAAAPAVSGSRVKDEMASYFQRLQHSVLTVWSETGRGTGFVVDPSGLIVTNHHVIGFSDYIAVQFDTDRKIAAIRLESDPSKDVAVLWANISAIPEAIAAPVASELPGVEEGERVFTIGSPLNQRKIMTSGIASKVEARAILSDVNINPGNSGGPLFNSLGEVVGITTFGDPSQQGPGVSGIVRIEEALPLVAKAQARRTALKPPQTEWLPVEPSEPFPIEAIKAAAQVEKFDVGPYVLGAGDYDVGVMTPIFFYRADQGEREAVKSKEKRTKQKDEAFNPAANLYNWAEYAGDYRAVVKVRATPKLRETFWSAVGRGVAAAGGSYYAGPASSSTGGRDLFGRRLAMRSRHGEKSLQTRWTVLVSGIRPEGGCTSATAEPGGRGTEHATGRSDDRAGRAAPCWNDAHGSRGGARSAGLADALRERVALGVQRFHARLRER